MCVFVCGQEEATRGETPRATGGSGRTSPESGEGESLGLGSQQASLPTAAPDSRLPPRWALFRPPSSVWPLLDFTLVGGHYLHLPLVGGCSGHYLELLEGGH